MYVLSFVGSPAFISCASVVSVILLAYFQRRRQAVLLAVTMLGSMLLDIGLKGIYTRERPEPFLDYVLPASYSFPSGHALGSFCFYGIAACLLLRGRRSVISRILFPTAAVTLVLLIGFSRVYFGVHYPTDVAAGFLVGFVWLLTVVLLDRFLQPRSNT